ncbi:hypothetical protein MKJ01_11610 [Chryseobacterium sp. SSA4.19]|uniref:hypothetical protein n=1 Tax=Chryseobacterium sp. SSA4.19 TaxID=2919915 RepID=UPI001F4DCBDC|nr:hypothetical protein [Chryseobacterium sp. SSA4.19]MCJ8154408.1 hypothetical protein [Chryseobacterium sp. SSA4.19]
MHFSDYFKTWYVCILLFMTSFYANAQEAEPSGNRIELSVKNKTGISRHEARSVSLSFSNPSKGLSSGLSSPDAGKEKKYFIAIDFATMDPALLQLITDYNTDFSGELKITGRKNNRMLQKIEFSGASMDNVTSQGSADDTSTFIYLWCREITVNDVKLK